MDTTCNLVTFTKLSKNGLMRHSTVAIGENTWFSMRRESATSSQHCGKERKGKERRKGEPMKGRNKN